MTSSSVKFARRDLLAATLAGAAAGATVAALPSTALAAITKKRRLTPTTRFKAMLAQFAQEILRLSPEQATGLGMDSGPRAGLKALLSDGSPAGEGKWLAQVQSIRSRLASVDRKSLTRADQVIYDTVAYAADRGVEGSKFFYGGAAGGFFGGATPYPVTQQDGAITSIPEFLNSQHQIKNSADAEAYLARTAALARVLDEETAQITRDAAREVMPPRFIAKTALDQLQQYRKTPAASQGLATSLGERTRALGIAADFGGKAAQLIEQLVYPALDRQIAAFSKATENAPETAGVHRLPDGEAYYAYALKLGTTTNLSPSEIHAIGIEQNRAIQSRMDAILKAQGMTTGSVGERLQALTKDPAQLYPDTPAGREALIAYCNEKVAAQRALMPGLTHMKMKAPLIIKRVPEDIQEGASLGYMNFASLDGSRPAIYYINLKSTSLWPKYQLTTLTAHEGIPGHAWQGAYLAENSATVPLMSSLMAFNAFVEGWALYSEQTCDEAGLYKNDPLSQLGYLQAQQFRACRLVVDTGLHAMKWTREQSIKFLVENTGRGENAMRSETDRYCVSPGQACGYKVGHNEILRLRDKAKAAMGSKFDLAAFNDAVVKTGGVPLTVLGTVIDQFIAPTAVAQEEWYIGLDSGPKV
jgi:uncharacterized protein (DUF885 family)